MPLELSLACPTPHSVMGPPDPHQLDLPPPNPFSIQPHFPCLPHRDSNDSAYIRNQQSFARARSGNCTDTKQMPSSSKRKEELAIDGMVLTLALAQDTTASSNVQKRTCRTWELGSNCPDYTNAMCDDQERALNEESSLEEGASGGAARKKLRLTKAESALLEERFKEQSTLTPKQKNELAKQLNLRPRQVEVWFQNRRARTKLKQTELDCELLKKCCATLTEENRRLQMEVAQLRALKVGPHSISPHDLCTQMPGTTLTMCAQCECISAPAAAPSSSTTTSNSSLHQAPLKSSLKQQPSPAHSS